MKKKEKKKLRKRKAPIVSSNKKESQYFERKNTSTSKILFDVIPFSPPPSYHFKKPSPKSLKKFS
jgi:hypothetical protein